MKKYLGALLLGASCTLAGAVHAQDPFADSVISYTIGTGSNASYNNPSVALGAPTTGLDTTFGNTPFSIVYPAYLTSQIVGIGNGGQLTVAFNTPITKDPVNHAFGMDFTIFGNEFFASGSSGFSGASVHSGLSVWVSQDDVSFYQLKVPNGYGADDWLPTQGNPPAGSTTAPDPGLPVNPALTLSSFTGLNEAQALALYNGSAGGASFSLSWAVDTNGNPVNLPSASYIEVQGTSGFGYVDAISRVESVPEPSDMALLLAGLSVPLGGRRFFRRKIARAKASL